MLRIRCPRDGETLASTDQIEALVNTSLGPVARVRCRCGALVTWRAASRLRGDLGRTA